MSTEFRTTDTDEWVCVRYAGANGLSFDWGADASRAFAVSESFFGDDTARVVDERGVVYTGTEFLALASGVGRDGEVDWTYGVFGGTMAVGSGDVATFEGLS